jgi:protein-disulfide isomerase
VPDLTTPLGPRDHVEGADDAPLELVMYGDFQCPFCTAAQPILRRVRDRLGDRLRFAFRHYPVRQRHPDAERAAQASEAAAAQGAFWDMHDRLLTHQDALAPADLYRHGVELDLQLDRFADDLRRRRFAPRIAEDVRSADARGVSGTPTFFVNGRRHQGVYDIDTLTRAVKAAARTAAQTRALEERAG